MLRPFLSAVLLAAAARAAEAQDRAALLLSDAPPPEGRRCEVLGRTPRAYAAVLDSAALRQALAAEPAGGAAGTVLYSIRWDEEGRLDWVRALENTLPEAAEARVQVLVRAHARAARASDPWSARVRVPLGGAAPEVRFGRSEVCRAVSDPGRGAMTMGGSERMRPEDLRDLERAGEARVEVRVGTSGEVLDVRMRQSSRSRFIDDVALRSAQGGRYLPELVDGAPVAVWSEMRIRRSARP